MGQSRRVFTRKVTPEAVNLVTDGGIPPPMSRGISGSRRICYGAGRKRSPTIPSPPFHARGGASLTTKSSPASRVSGMTQERDFSRKWWRRTSPSPRHEVPSHSCACGPCAVATAGGVPPRATLPRWLGLSVSARLRTDGWSPRSGVSTQHREEPRQSSGSRNPSGPGPADRSTPVAWRRRILSCQIRSTGRLPWLHPTESGPAPSRTSGPLRAGSIWRWCWISPCVESWREGWGAA